MSGGYWDLFPTFTTTDTIVKACPSARTWKMKNDAQLNGHAKISSIRPQDQVDLISALRGKR